MRKKTYYSACIIPLNRGKRKKICRNFAVQGRMQALTPHNNKAAHDKAAMGGNFAVQGRMQVDASIDPYNKNCPRQNTAGRKNRMLNFIRSLRRKSP